MKKTLIIVGVVLVILVAGLYVFRARAKSFSPEGNVDFADGKLKIHVFYNRPFKKGRTIFGDLVPYGKTWRTGANEATTFECNQPLSFGEKSLSLGKYSLWTVPGKETWQVVFNSEIPSWGINYNGESLRDSTLDALVIEEQVSHPRDKVIEQFTINVEKNSEGFELVFLWDNTVVAVPFNLK